MLRNLPEEKIVGRQRERESLQAFPVPVCTPSRVECRSVAEISISFILHIYITPLAGRASKFRAHKPIFYPSSGFAGELCNFEYNECESNPCQNAGECIDHIGSFECRCTKGYTGYRCQIKVSAKECQIA